MCLWLVGIVSKQRHKRLSWRPPVHFLVSQIFFLGFLSCNFNGLNSTLPRTAPQVLTRRGSLFPCGAGHASLVSQRQALEMEKLERDAKVQQLPSKNIWCVTCEVPLAFDQMLVFFSIAADDSKQVEQKCPAGFFPVPPEYQSGSPTAKQVGTRPHEYTLMS